MNSQQNAGNNACFKRFGLEPLVLDPESRAQGSYPLGRREAGCFSGHLRTEEGLDVLGRFVEVAGHCRATLAAADDGLLPGSARMEGEPRSIGA